MINFKKVISIVLLSSLCLGAIIPIQPVEAHHTKSYRLRRSTRRVNRVNNSQIGIASNYGYKDGYHGKRTANGEIYNMNSNTCAHRRAKFGTMYRVTNLMNGKQTVCRVNDRGPYVSGRIIDLSYYGFSQIANPKQGLTRVKIEKLN